MTRCDLPLPEYKGSQIISIPIQAQGTNVTERSQVKLWLSQFNWINWIGLVMFTVPVIVSYFVVHYWLLQHDLLLYYTSLYAQLGLLLMAWRQL